MAELSPKGTITGRVVVEASVSGGIDLPQGLTIKDYTGDYIFTPSQQEQTINIAGKRAITDITINPIPQNYGLITWNGSFLTVS